MTAFLAGIVQSLVEFLDGGQSGEPHNDALLIIVVFLASVAFWHALFWRRMTGHRRFWRSIDYVWYSGAFLSVVLGTFAAERAAEASRVRGLGQLIEVEMQRQDLMVLAMLTECGGASAGGTPGTGMFDAAMCAAARPVLRDARLYVFEHMSGVDTLFFIEAKMARLAAMCAGLGEEVEKGRAAADEADAENVAERLYFQIYCDDAQVMGRRVEEFRQGSAAQGARGPFGDVAHLWPLLLCLVVGLRITKTTAEVRQAGRPE
ncbi:MAG: hypothetical protein AB7N54_07380 [Alphaproteobacteria bacterium]